jgi:glycosyltransferase involved in cell wall biosynthesis
MVAIKTEKLPSLSIVFPAYNEEKNITISIDRAQFYAKRRNIDYEIIVVDDGSRDATAKMVSDEIKADERVKLIRHKKNQGYGATVCDGLNAASKDFVFFTDSDLQFDINELDQFIKKIEGYDAVIGYRNPRRDPLMRLVNAWGWKYLIALVFGVKVGDLDCAFKLFRRDVLKKIKVKSRGAMFSAELIIRLIINKNKISQLPVNHYKRVAGNPTGAKLSVIFRAFKELFAIRAELNGELAQIERCDRIIS